MPSATAPTTAPTSAPTTAPARPALALPPRPAQRRGLWAVPLLLSLVFVAGVLAWLVHTEEAEREEQRQELISDALSLQTQMDSQIDDENRLLHAAAARLDALARPGDVTRAPAPGWVATPEIQQGLHRFWVSLTWLDAANRIVAHLPEFASAPRREAAANGLSAHLSAPLAGGGTLVARYSPSDLLRRTVPWWLARKYDVRLVDSFGDVIASTADGRELPGRQAHRIAMGPALVDSVLELTARDRITPWYASLPVTVVAVFLTLIAATTAMLRRQVRDVSRAETNWRTEAAWRSAMEESLTVGLRARDFDGRLLYVNRTLADLIGYAPEELLGLLPPMPYWPADSLEEILLRHARNMAGQAPRGGYEARWRHKQGRIVDVMVFEAPLVDAAGRHIGWMGSILDITEKKRLEERERRQTETVTHHARLTMLGEVASTLAHELNQPLTAISSYNAGVLNSLQRADAASGAAADPAVLRALQRLGEQAAHAGRIVQRIREFLTRREPQLETGSLNAIVEGGIALLRRELARQQVRLVLELDATLPSLVVDAVLIEQVVINLVRNAVDAQTERTPAPGGERVVERVVERLVEHGVKRRVDRGIERVVMVRTLRAPGDDPRALRVEVRDRGPGLQGQRIEALCAPFHSTRKDGMGMGLAICRSILEAHQGTLDACDRAEGGACFGLTLPIDLRVTATAAEDSADPAGRDRVGVTPQVA